MVPPHLGGLAVRVLSVVLLSVAALFVEALATPMIMGVLDVLATLFTFIAGVVLAAKLGVHSCGNKVRFRRKRCCRPNILLLGSS